MSRAEVQKKRVRRVKRGIRVEPQEGDSTGATSWEMSEEEDKREIPSTESRAREKISDKTKKDIIMNLMAELMTYIEQDQELRNMMRKMMMVMYKRNEEEKENAGPRRKQKEEEVQRNKEKEILKIATGKNKEGQRTNSK
ncbi:hypothetical protein PV325_002232 [Microctonus aethiopoides]|nr:hypothetical protein PV325_002232 [Microctonus aethiopoides]